MIKTVNLTTEVTAVDVAGKQNVIVKNIGNNTAYVSASPDISAGGDDVVSVKAGELITLEGVATLKKVGNRYGVHGTVYALASGATTIELIPTNSVNFKPAAVDFSGEISDISALIPAAANAGNQLTDKAYVDSELSEKVDKVGGMGLSSNDYTTDEKDKLAALTNYDDSTVNSAIADLQAGKADKSDTYTKTETDTKITEKVAEIVADAPEDFDTLKEMSDWISNHENDAAAMNSAIQTNASNISSLQAGKVDKAEGKSLVSDSEIARLASLENYDDTAVKSDIADIQSVIPAAASPENQLADKAYVSAATSGSPYIYMSQAEYEALTEYETDRLYWVTYPLSKCHLIWCNGECVDGIGAYEGTYSYKYMAIGYSPTGSNTKNVEKIDIARGVTSIGSSAFNGCTALTDISIPDSISRISVSSTFYGCSELQSISFPENVTFSDNWSGTFLSCTNLKNVTFPENFTLGGGKSFLETFRNCENLSSIVIPNGITTISTCSFYQCHKLVNITIPNSVTEILSSAFGNCTSLEKIIIPEGVKTIGQIAFWACSNLRLVSIPSTVTKIYSGTNSDSFGYCSRSDLTITINKPAGSISGSPWGATNATVIWTG